MTTAVKPKELSHKQKTKEFTKTSERIIAMRNADPTLDEYLAMKKRDFDKKYTAKLDYAGLLEEIERISKDPKSMNKFIARERKLQTEREELKDRIDEMAIVDDGFRAFLNRNAESIETKFLTSSPKVFNTWLSRKYEGVRNPENPPLRLIAPKGTYEVPEMLEMMEDPKKSEELPRKKKSPEDPPLLFPEEPKEPEEPEAPKKEPAIIESKLEQLIKSGLIKPTEIQNHLNKLLLKETIDQNEYSNLMQLINREYKPIGVMMYKKPVIYQRAKQRKY